MRIFVSFWAQEKKKPSQLLSSHRGYYANLSNLLFLFFPRLSIYVNTKSNFSHTYKKGEKRRKSLKFENKILTTKSKRVASKFIYNVYYISWVILFIGWNFFIRKGKEVCKNRREDSFLKLFFPPERRKMSSVLRVNTKKVMKNNLNTEEEYENSIKNSVILSFSISRGLSF